MQKIRFNLWFWLLLALIVRVYKISLVYCIASDGAAYIKTAERLLAGGGFHPLWPPFYPWLISLLTGRGLEPELSGTLISLIFGLGVVALTYFVTKEIFSLRVAGIATIFAVFHPFLVRYSAEVLAETVFTFFLILTIFLGWQARRKENVFPVLGMGIACALAYLTKPEAVVLMLLIPSWWIFPGAGAGIGRRLINVALAVIVFLLITFPYLGVVHEITGQWLVSQKQTVVFSLALQEEGYTDTLEEITPVQYLISQPALFCRKIGKDLLVLAGRFPDAYHPLLFIFLLIALFNRWPPNWKPPAWYIFSLFFVYCLGYALYHPGRRYLVSWVPLLLFLAAFGWLNTVAWLESRTRRRVGTVALWAVILIMLPNTLTPVHKRGGQWKTAGLWLGAHTFPGAKIMAKDERVAFYAQGRYIPWGSARAEYIVGDEEFAGLELLHTINTGLKIYKR